MSTKRQGDHCYNKADLDEPIFVLRSTDALAPRIVRRWAMALEVENGRATAKSEEARELADAMEHWQREHPELVKIPD